ncbi:Sensor histidine kinase RcsC [Sporomusa silvacetica DSM 10669]|uniref:histidine kinase n=1 Tax=Sporomusa silvacetica DSM 10669 TaxID=1123289 RepID=A0ABZ3IEG4_9FIRM|nr:ATP-binding protein [Sporomusa silvacetica]OZC22599.1 sensory/regulatory protein RpfC [Sporomusa silvacetica DSM 10669]
MDNYRRWLIIITIIVLAAGWLGMSLAVKLTEEELQSKLLLRAVTAATMISHDRIARLTATAADSGSSDYEYLREQLIATRALNTDCRFVYLLKRLDNRMVFLLDSEPTTSGEYSPPGYEYKQASDELYQIFSDGQAFVEGPLSDEWGLWVSGIAAVRDPADGRVIAALGLDIAARDWQAAIATTRLIVMGVTLAVLLMIYALLYALHTSARAATRVYQAEKQAKEAVEAVSQAKSQFMAYLSHEIRTPVSGILGVGELLETTLLDKRQRDYVSTIAYSARSLLTVLNEVLDFSKIEANKMTVDNIDFAFRPLLEGVATMLQATAYNKGLELSVTIDQSIPQLVGGDPTRLRQVLLNLVGNAIKFTEIGMVEIAAVCLWQDASTVQVKITVTDTGIGLDPIEIKKLFQPFAQADGANARKYMGSGLGLSISGSLIKLMGGEIGVISSKGEGSSFWCSIPLAVVNSASESVVNEPVSNTQPIEEVPAWLIQPPVTVAKEAGTVLIVEDNPVIQQVVVSQLGHLGLTADVAGNGQEAVQKALKTGYKLIFMDCGLPLLDGVAATRLIRDKEAESGWHTPIIALSGKSMPDEQQQCLAAGMDDCLVKPVSIQDIKQMVERWLPQEATDSIDISVLRELKQLADSGQSELDVFIDAYLEELPLLTDKLRQAMITCNTVQVSMVAHSLKSMSGTIGAKRLSELFSSLEQIANRDSCDNHAEARMLMSKIDIECKQVGPALKNAARLV